MPRNVPGTSLAFASTVILCISVQLAGAAQISSGMGVGLTIEPSSAGGGERSIRKQSVLGLVTKDVPETIYTWNAAAISLKRAGFKESRRMEKQLSLYWFEAKREKTSFRIAVSMASGKIVKVVRP